MPLTIKPLLQGAPILSRNWTIVWWGGRCDLMFRLESKVTV